jgi:hypothetical protein
VSGRTKRIPGQRVGRNLPKEVLYADMAGWDRPEGANEQKQQEQTGHRHQSGETARPAWKHIRRVERSVHVLLLVAFYRQRSDANASQRCALLQTRRASIEFDGLIRATRVRRNGDRPCGGVEHLELPCCALHPPPRSP